MTNEEELKKALTVFIKSGSANGNEAMRKECLSLVDLFAAAQELLEAVKIAADFINEIRCHDMTIYGQLSLEKLPILRAAIAKAEGL